MADLWRASAAQHVIIINQFPFVPCSFLIFYFIIYAYFFSRCVVVVVVVVDVDVGRGCEGPGGSCSVARRQRFHITRPLKTRVIVRRARARASSCRDQSVELYGVRQ